MVMIIDYIITMLNRDSQDIEALRNYIDIITQALISDRKRYKTSDVRYVYYENHHILPRSLYPDYVDDKLNKVLLTAQEHFTAHKLLTNIFPGQQMSYAYWRMCCCNRDRCIITAEDYEHGRLLNSKYPPFKGKHFTEESKQKIGMKSKEYWANGGYVHTKEQDQKMVATRRKNGTYIRSEESNVKCSNTMKGRIYVNNGFKNKQINPDELDTYINEGWKKGKKPLSEEHKKKIGEASKGRTGWNKGKPGTFLGKKHTEETKRKMSEAKKIKKENKKDE